MSHPHRAAHRGGSPTLESLEPRRLLAAAGDLDLSFGAGTGKSVVSYVGSTDDSGDATLALGDGKLLVGGSGSGGDSFATLTRYLANGQPDSTFGTAGIIKFAGLQWSTMLDLIPSGGSTFTGLGSSPATVSSPMIQRFTADGALDPTWIGPGTAIAGTPRAIAPAGDGRMVVATSTRLARLNADGTLDTTFGTGGIVTLPSATYPNYLSYPPYAVVVLSDDSILIGGEQSSALNGNKNAMVRKYSSTGVFDTTFNAGSGTLIIPTLNLTASGIRGMKLQTNGKILVAGYTGSDSFVARITSTGAMDLFGSNGVRTWTVSGADVDSAGRIALTSTGTIYVGGVDQSAGSPYLARLSSTGTLDTTFDGNGIVEQPLPAAWPKFGGANIALTSGDQLVMASGAASDYSHTFDQTISRYTAAGALDSAFGDAASLGVTRTDFTGTQPIYLGRAAIQPDGKIIQTGSPRFTAGDAAVLRRNADGSVDAAFGNNGIVSIDAGARLELATDVLVQPDGKILIAGRADDFNPTTGWTNDFLLARLNPDGTPDTGFGANGVVRTNFNGSFEMFSAVTLTSDGHIFAAGTFSDASSRNAAVMRYSDAGVLDTGFGTGGMRRIDDPADATIAAIAASGTGVLLGGYTSASTGSDQRFVMRLDALGNNDPGFGTNGITLLDDPSTTTETAFGLIVESSTGDIDLGGVANSKLLLTKLSAAGVPVSGFGTAGTASIALISTDEIADMAQTPQGQFVFAGTRIRPGSSPSDRDNLLLRANSNGQLDSAFGAGGVKLIDFATTDDSAADVLLGPAGRIVVAGSSDGNRILWSAARVLGSGDFTPPAVTATTFQNTSGDSIGIAFDEDVLDSLGADDIEVRSITTGDVLPSSQFDFLASGAPAQPTTGTWTYNAGVLPESQYRVTLKAGSVADGSGNVLATAQTFDFFTATDSGTDDAYQITFNAEGGGAGTATFIHTPGGGSPQTSILDLSAVKILAINAGSGNDSLRFIGSDADDAIAANPGSFIRAGLATQYAHVESVAMARGTFTAANDLGAGAAFTVEADATLNLGASQHLAGLTLWGKAAFAPGASHVLVTDALAIDAAAQLDLADASLILHSTDADHFTDAARVADWIRTGLNLSGPRWRGNGINSSTAAADAGRLHAIGTLANDVRPLGQAGALYTRFAGENVWLNDVLVRSTWFGDADLDGAVTTNDYFQIDNGFLGSRTGWINGDFDYDHAVSTNDYFAIDNAFLGQSGEFSRPSSVAESASAPTLPAHRPGDADDDSADDESLVAALFD